MNIQKLKTEQIKLSKKLIIKDDFDDLKYIAGCNQTILDNKVISGVVLLDIKTMEIIEKKYSCVPTKINYIPGFISYRESPAVIEAISKLNIKPDILMINANGIIHPRKMGMASHLGILLDMPTIGIAGKLVTGELKDGKVFIDGEVRGVEIHTKEYAKEIYVSPGHRISIKTAKKLVIDCSVSKHKLPEPLHEAHKYSKKIKKRLEEKK